MRFSLPKQVCVLLILGAMVAGQSSSDVQSQRLEVMPDTYADNEQAYLDLLAAALTRNTASRGYLVAYTKPGLPPGTFLRRIYGYKNYLVNLRGIDSNRITIIEGGTKDVLSTELWVVPNGAEAPKAVSELNLISELPSKFDTIFPDCPSEMTIYLEGTLDSLHFYARALVENPNTTAKILTYPGRRASMTKMRGVSNKVRVALIQNYHIDGKRIVTSSSKRRRDCSEVELWLTGTKND
jgi:hypothetical protein